MTITFHARISLCGNKRTLSTLFAIFIVWTLYINDMTILTSRPRVLSEAQQVGEFRKHSRILLLPEKQIFLKLLRRFAIACDHFNVTYMLMAGSLLGSYRHHGFVPWDDDVDLWLDFSKRDKLADVVGFMGKHYTLWSGGARWKITSDQESWPTSAAWPWPFIDLFFYNETEGMIYDSDSTTYDWQKKFVSGDIFPLIKRPFEGYWFKAPRTLAIIDQDFRSNCCTGRWDHRQEKRSVMVCLKCKSLYADHMFVFPRPLRNKRRVLEKLMLRGRTVSSIPTRKWIKSYSELKLQENLREKELDVQKKELLWSRLWKAKLRTEIRKL